MTTSKHIAITANTSWYLYNFRGNLIKALIADGHHVTAIAPQDNYSEKLKALGCDFKHIDIDQRGTNPVIDFLCCVAFYRLYKQLKPAVVLNFTPKNNIYSTLAASRLGIKCVNNIAGLGSVFIEEGLTARIARWLYKISQKHAATVFFQNDEDMQLMLKAGYVTAEQSQRLPGSGVDLKRFRATPKTHDNGNIVFILIARMLYQKGIAEYVAAAEKIRAIYPNTEFRLLGFIDNKNPSAIPVEVIQQWHDSGAIRYLGTSDNVEDEIAQSDCVVLPSYYREGVPRSLLEGAAMGKPLVTTDNVGCRETVEEGVNGFLVATLDVAALVTALVRIVELSHIERENMGTASRRLVGGKFDEGIVVNAYVRACAP